MGGSFSSRAVGDKWDACVNASLPFQGAAADWRFIFFSRRWRQVGRVRKRVPTISGRCRGLAVHWHFTPSSLRRLLRASFEGQEGYEGQAERYRDYLIGRWIAELTVSSGERHSARI